MILLKELYDPLYNPLHKIFQLIKDYEGGASNLICLNGIQEELRLGGIFLEDEDEFKYIVHELLMLEKDYSNGNKDK